MKKITGFAAVKNDVKKPSLGSIGNSVISGDLVKSITSAATSNSFVSASNGVSVNVEFVNQNISNQGHLFGSPNSIRSMPVLGSSDVLPFED